MKAGFKYRVDFDALRAYLTWQRVRSVRFAVRDQPTRQVTYSPTMMARLDKIARKYDIPLIIDNAYGMPFPNIIHADTTLSWDEQTILCFSLSKIGLPGARTGIIVASPQVIRAVSAMNAIVNLSPVRFGATIATPLFADDRIIDLADNHIQPFYKNNQYWR